MLLFSRTAVVLMGLATGFSLNCEPQTTEPPVKVYAYAREVIGGIPGGPPRGGGPTEPQQMRYLIYVEAPPNAKVSADGVWIKGTFYSVETTPKKAPVRFESPVKLADDSKSIAVPATTNAVIEVVPTAPVADKTPDASTSNLLRENEAVLQLTYAGKTAPVPIKKFERKDPLYLR
jgi:hypothetical protein